MIRVLIVDDHDVGRAGLRTALSDGDDILVVGECADGLQTVAAVGAVRPDIVLMDRQMPMMTGTAATRAVLAARSPRSTASIHRGDRS
jgi:DNA-binding NarL/FixJ family response regulator